MKRLLGFYIFLSAFIFAAVAAPHNGDEFSFRQPDGSLVPVIVWGDEFYQTVESPDGYTLIRDADGWITYARLSADGDEFLSTGVRYMGPQSAAPAVQRNLRISGESAERKIRKNKEALGIRDEDHIPRDNRRKRKNLDDGSFAPASINEEEHSADGISPAPEDEELLQSRKIGGLALLIDFPDQTSNITHAAMSDFFNRHGGVNGTTASGSVRDWFYDVSNGLLDYTNKVTRFFRAANNKNTYDTGTDYSNVRVLMGEVLAQVKADVETGGSDILCDVTTELSNGNNLILATNVYYAGSPAAGWSNGLWPHSGTYGGNNRDITIPANRCGPNTPAITVRISRYQLTSLGTGNNPPSIGTTIHENGHMIMRWPDLYSYSDANPRPAEVVSSYCVMSGSNGGNPQQPNPYFRDLAGWIEAYNITNANGVMTHSTNIAQTAGNPRLSTNTDAYQFIRNDQESYYIEARRRVGRSSNIPGEGLIIWHVHTSGRNTNINTAARHPLVKVIQSNNAASTAEPFVSIMIPRQSGSGSDPNPNAPFNATRNQFHGTSSPPALYYEGAASTIRITEISNINTSTNTMTFRIGTGGDGAKLITRSMISPIPEVVFTGTAHTPVLTVRDGAATLVSGTHYNATLTPRTDAGTYTVTVTGIGSYTGSTTVNFVINPRPLTGATVTVGGTYTYTGLALTPTAANITITLPGYTPTFNSNSRTASNNINAGTATVTVTGNGNFIGTATGTFTIQPRALAANMVQAIPAATFNGEAQTPGLTLTYNQRTLAKDTDYTVTPEQQINAGTHALTVTGTGNYTGTRNVNFVINRKPLTAEILDASAVFNGEAQTPVITVTDIMKTLEIDADFTTTITPQTNVGTYTGTITGRGNYSGTVSVDFVIDPKPLTEDMLNIPPVMFSGAAQTPVLTVTDGAKTLVMDVDYAVDGLTPQTDIGTYLVAVEGKGNYSGSLSVDFVINVNTAVLTLERKIPGNYDDGAGALHATPVLAQFTAGPNPVVKSVESVNFFRQGKRVLDATLTVYDASGNVVNRVKIKDKKDGNSRRIVGSWDLTDRRGRKVSEGTYLVKGVIRDVDGKKEKVSLILGVR